MSTFLLKHKTATFLIALGLFVAVSVYYTAGLVLAAPNLQINYQGKLTNASNVAVADAGYQMEFSLYTASTSGTAIWTETRTGANEVQVQNGLFSVMLGSVNSLAGVNFDQTLYLGVTIEADSEMTPRKVLGAVPAAFEANNANTVGGVASTSILRNDRIGAIATTSASTLLTITQSGTGDILNLFDGGTEVFSVLDGGNIGIGSTSPSSKLTVAGNTFIGGNLTATGTLAISGTSTLATTTVTDLTITRALRDTTGVAGTNGMILQTTGTSTRWVATSTLGLLASALTGIGPAGQIQSGPSITIASSTGSFNGLTTGITITGAGNTLTYTPSITGLLTNAGLATPWLSFATTSTGTDLSFSSASSTLGGIVTLNIPNSSATARGLLTSTDWTTFNGKISSSSLDTIAELDTLITDVTGVTGTGSFVLSASPTFTGTVTLANSINTNSTSTNATTTNLAVTTLTPGRLTFAGTGGRLIDSTNLTFDGSRLATLNLGVTGTSTFTGTTTFATSTVASSTITTLNLVNALAVTSGGTGATTAAGARTNLGATTVGANIFTLANPGTLSFLRINADNTVSAVATSTLGIALADTTGVLDATRGGTGLATITNNQLLIGGAGNTITQVATSSLGLSAAFTNSSQLAGLLSDETGTGAAVFAGSPLFTGTAGFVNLTATGTLAITGTSTFATSSFTGNVAIGLSTTSNPLHIRQSQGDLEVKDLSVFSGSNDLGLVFDGGSAIESGLFTEVNGEVLSYAINTPQITTRNTSRVGGIFRLDTRVAQQKFVVFGYATGGSVELERFGVSLQTGNVTMADSGGNVGIGSSSPSSKLTVGGNTFIGGNLTATGTLAISGTSTLATTTVTDLTIARALRDTTGVAGTAGMVLQTTGTSTRWVATSTLGFSGGGASTFLALTDTPSSYTANRVMFTNGAANALIDSANFTFDGSRLVTLNLGVSGTSTFTGTSTFATTTIASLNLGQSLSAMNGGTGLTSYATGDLIYASGANTLANRTIGTTGQILSVQAGVPTWTSTSSLGLVNLFTSTGTTTYLTSLTDNFGLGTSNPTSRLTVAGTMNVTGTSTFSDTATFTNGVLSNYFGSTAADIADAGAVRLGNFDAIAWEASPAGGDVLIRVDSAEQMQFQGAGGSGYVFDNGISLGSSVASGVTNLNRHLDLFGGTYGFNVTNNTINYVSGGGIHDFYNGGSRVMSIVSANLGIGTNNPQARLDVGTGLITGGSNSASYRNTFNLSGSSGFPAIDFNFPGTGYFRVAEVGILGTNDVFFQALPATGAGYGYLEAWAGAGMVVGTGNSTPVIFRPNRTEAMRVAGNGNVGVGTTTPGAKFSVTGNSLFGGNMTVTGTLAVAGATTLNSLSVVDVTVSNLTATTSLAVSGTSTLATTTVTDLTIARALRDTTGVAGTNGMVLQTTGTSTRWVATSTLGFFGGGATTFLALTDTPGSFTANRVLYTNPGATALTDSANFTFDGSRLATLNLGVSGTSTFTGTSTFSGNVGIGTTSPLARLSIEKTGMTGTQTAGIDQYFGITNSTLNAVLFGNNTYIDAAPTATSTIAGSIIKIADNTILGNNVQGLQVQTNRGSNTRGENTAIAGFGRTFGVRGTTEGDAGAMFEPAGVFAETRGTTLGNAMRAYSDSITTADLVSFDQDSSAFSGNGLMMDFGTGGSFTGNFMKLRNGGTDRLTIDSLGGIISSSTLAILGTSTLATTTVTDLTIARALRDSTNSAGTAGMVLQTTGTSTRWVATSTLGFSGGGASTFLGLTDTPGSFTANRIIFTNPGATALTDSANFTFDGTNLGFGNTQGISWGGTRALSASTTRNNYFFGAGAGGSITTGSNVIAIGLNAFQNATSVSDIIAIGTNAGISNTSGSGNVFIGPGFTGFSNTTGGENVFIGYGAGGNSRTGGGNTLIGNNVGNGLVSGDSNTYFGANAGLNLATSTNSTIIGIAAGFGLGGSYQASNLTLLGREAGFNLQTGANNNILIGHNAANSMTTGANNLIIGYDVEAPSNTASNQLNIGNLIFGTGIDGTGTTLSSGNIGIGSTTPSAKLTVAGTLAISGTSTLATTTVTDLTIARALRDTTNSAGTAGMVLQTTGTSTRWVATSTLGFSGGGASTFLGLTDTPGSFTANRIMFTNPGATALIDNANFTFNGTTLAAPSAALTGTLAVTGTSSFAGIGIGTTTSSNALHIIGASSQQEFAFGDAQFTLVGSNNTTGRTFFSGNAGNGASERRGYMSVGLTEMTLGTMSTNGSIPLNLFTNGTTRMTIGINGNIGIGSTSPTSLLTVAGAGFFGGNLTATGTLAISGTSTLATTTVAGSFTAPGFLSDMGGTQFFNPIYAQGNNIEDVGNLLITNGFLSNTGTSTLATTTVTDLTIARALRDTTGVAGTAGMVLQTTGTSTRWVATSTLGITGGGSSLFTDGGATSYLTSLTDNLAVGTTSASERLTVAGNINLLSNTASIKFNDVNILRASTTLGNYIFGNSTASIGTGLDNILIGGSDPGNSLTTGNDRNTFIGSSAGHRISGSNSLVMGYGAGYGLGGVYTASGIVALGAEAGQSLSNGADNNTLIGRSAGSGVTTGAGNVMLGFQTGGITTGARNIVIGSNINAASTTSSNQLNIGNLIYGTGLDGTGSTLSTGNIGIGTTSLLAKFTVAGDTIISGTTTIIGNASGVYDWTNGQAPANAAMRIGLNSSGNGLVIKEVDGGSSANAYFGVYNRFGTEQFAVGSGGLSLGANQVAATGGFLSGSINTVGANARSVFVANATSTSAMLVVDGRSLAQMQANDRTTPLIRFSRFDADGVATAGIGNSFGGINGFDTGTARGLTLTTYSSSTASFIDVMTLSSNGNVGIGSSSPSSKLTVAGAGFFGGNLTATGTLAISGTSTLATTTVTDLTIARALRDTTGVAGTAGMVLQTTGTSTRWVATSTLGITGGGGGTFLSLTDTPSSFTANRVMFTNTGASALTDSANFTFDGSRLATLNLGVSGTSTLATTSVTRLGINKVASPGIAADLYVDGTTVSQGLRIEGATAVIAAFNSYVTGDSQIRFSFAPTGAMTWGSGSAPVDTNLYRLSASTLHTDSAFSVGGTLAISGTSTLATTTASTLTVSGAFRDSTGNAGTNGWFLQSTGTSTRWVAGGGGGLASTDIDTSSELAAILGDETGSAGGGVVVFSNAPTLTGTTTMASTSILGSLQMGTTSTASRFNLDVNNFATAGTAGLNRFYTSTNAASGTVQFGELAYNRLSTTGTTTYVGSMFRVEDNTLLGNTVRGLEVQTNRGTNTLGENTALSGFARTFGVRGFTSADAGSIFEPAGGYFETGGTTQGNAIRGYSATITSANLASLFQDTSTFSGTGLMMNFGNTTGSFTGNFVDLQKAGVSQFRITNDGSVGIGTTASPTSKLTVGGNILITGNARVGNATTSFQSTRVFTGATDQPAGVQYDQVQTSLAFDGDLYLGMSGAVGEGDLLRYDGSTTTLVWNGAQEGIYAMANYKGRLFFGQGNTDGDANVFRYDPVTATTSTTTAAGFTSRDFVMDLEVFNGRLYALVQGAFNASEPVQVFVLDENETSWTQVFTTTLTARGGSMLVHEGALYVAVSNTTTNMGIYTTTNGTNWSTQALHTQTGASNYRPKLFVFDNEIHVASAGNVWRVVSNVAATGFIQVLSQTSVITEVATIDGEVYFGHGSTTITALNQQNGNGAVSRFRGATTTFITSPTNDQVSTISKYNNEIYFGYGDDTGEADLFKFSSQPQATTSYALQFATDSGLGQNATGTIWFESRDILGNFTDDLTGMPVPGTFFMSHSLVTNAGAYDVAEDYPTKDTDLRGGDLLMYDIDNDGHMTKATSDQRNLLGGVVSARPGFLLSQADRTGMVATALVGRVPVVVNNQNGPISIGDSVTISDEPGIGMKANFGDKSIGYALGYFTPATDDETATGTVLVYVSNHTALGMSPMIDVSNASSSNSSSTDDIHSADAESGFFARLERLVGGFINGVLTITGLKSEKIETDTLCVGSTCVNEAQLIELLNQNNVTPVEPEPDPEPTPDPEPEGGGEGEGSGGETGGEGTGGGDGSGNGGTGDGSNTGGGGDIPNPNPAPEPDSQPPVEEPPTAETPEPEPIPEPESPDPEPAP